MMTHTQPRFTSTQLNGQIRAYIQTLAEATDQARVSSVMTDYLESCARFHQYSSHNIWLIRFQKPEATRVAGFQRWKKMGRFVRKGESGIPILAPIFRKVQEEDSDYAKLVNFRVVYVFDISQTEGEPLPLPPEWKSPQQHVELQARLTAFAEQNDIRVNVQELSGEIQGISRGGVIELSPQAGTKTLIHEIAHELMHQQRGLQRSQQIEELEAESVAYVVGRYFGLDDLASPNYVALHGVDAALILAHMQRIQETAKDMISTMEKESE